MNAIEDQARSIFLAALERAPVEWPAFLDETCGADAELRARVDQLLNVHQAMGSIHGGGADALAVTVDEPLTERPGTVIGPFKLLEQIGEGGFGVVFMAEQQHPVRRKVALKVLKPGMDTRQVVARFEAERQALAIMDHPNIAKVHDGGETATGRPYFVMELVKGVPITEFCDQNQLPVQERLGLFISVCQAVQHAHQKGVIHRDLKPSNVVVQQHEGVPAAKVIDFGIAKATGQQLTDKTLFTGFAQMIGTPLYMSPEQAAGGPDIDTRSDIYSLGVLLYEVLTGTTPFDKDRFKDAGYDEIRRIIREEEPPKPSTRLSTLGQMATTVSTQRKSNPARLTQLFRGELDWIVMKALEKDRNRRYETASALAADVQCYLNDEPVQAYPPSAWYRCGKFARRHRGALASAGLVLFVLVALGAGGGWMVRDRDARWAAIEHEVCLATNEAERLQRQAKYTEALSAAKRAGSLLAGGASESLRQRVEDLLKDLEMVLRLEEIFFPRAKHGTEGGYDNRWADASYAEAFREYGIDVDVLEPAEAARHIRARSIRLELAAALDCWADRRQKGLLTTKVVRDAWPDQRDYNPKAGDVSWKRLIAVARAADPDDWRDQVRAALEGRDRKTLNKLATSAQISDLPVQTLSVMCEHLDYEYAEPTLRRTQLEHPDNYWINLQLAWISKDPDEIIRFSSSALTARPRSAATACILGNALHWRGKLDEAVTLYRKAIALDPDVVWSYSRLIEALRSQGKRDEAIAEIRAAIAARPNNAELNNGIAWILATCPDAHFRDPRLAVELASRAVELAPNEGFYWNTLGAAHYRAGDWNGAITALEKSMSLGKGGDSFDWFFIAMTNWQLGAKEAARSWYDRADQWMEKNAAANKELQSFRAEAALLLEINKSK